jgi:hypothetical protein
MLQESFDTNGSVSLLLRKMPNFANSIKQQKQYGRALYAESNIEQSLVKKRDGGNDQQSSNAAQPQRKHSFSALFLGWVFYIFFWLRDNLIHFYIQN